MTRFQELIIARQAAEVALTKEFDTIWVGLKSEKDPHMKCVAVSRETTVSFKFQEVHFEFSWERSTQHIPCRIDGSFPGRRIDFWIDGEAFYLAQIIHIPLSLKVCSTREAVDAWLVPSET